MNDKRVIICSLLLLLAACSGVEHNPLLSDDILSKSPYRLLVEGNQQPLNVHSQTPSLSWRSEVDVQQAYQIQVASDETLLQVDSPDLWDSGKIVSRRSLNIPYQGKPLSASSEVFWRVRIWQSGQENASQWSQTNRWEMGLLESKNWLGGWIQAEAPKPSPVTPEIQTWAKMAGTVDNNDGTFGTLAIPKLLEMPPAQLFRKSFSINKPIKRARLHSTAAGYYEIYINGKAVSERIMDPGQTDYDKRILYNTDDVIELLASGNNTLAVHLGSGWYHEDIAFSKVRSLAYGQPAFIAQLDVYYQDGTVEHVVSDESWLSHPSAILKEGIFSGEVFDAEAVIPNWNQSSQAIDLSNWQSVKVLSTSPTLALEPQLLPPVKAVETLTPQALFNPRPGVWVVDFGQNFTGIPTLDIAAMDLQDGQTVYLRFAEWADENGEISQKSGGGFATLLNQVDAYIASDAYQQKWRPTFTWHGFRYMEITGLKNKPSLAAISAELVKSSVETIGTFSSSDPHINRVHETALWGYRSNLVSVPMDCPIRERAGWTGDAHAALITGNYNFDMQNFWQKYLNDFKTATFIAPAIVPGKRTLGRSVDWAVAEVFIAWEHYQHHGDEQLLAEQYTSMLEYMTFGESQLSKYLIEKGYGDWCDPVRQPGLPRVGGRGTPQHTAPTITSTALFARASDLMSRIAAVLGKHADQEKYAALYKNISTEFHATFYDPESGHYGSQTADAMAIRFGITPKELRADVAAALNRDVLENWNGHSSVGALGQTWLYLALSDYGYTDTAFNIFTQPGYPGFHYLFDVLNGTTLWERKGQFDPSSGNAPERSLNHPFHAGYDGWFYQGLGGIRPLEDSPGFQEFDVRPVFPSDLDSVNVTFETGYGVIESRWRRLQDSIILNVVVPANSTAHISLPRQATQIRTTGEYEFVVQP